MFARNLVLAAALLGARADDTITSLPGWSGAQKMWAGYVNVNASHGRNLFYWLVESANSPATAPLVFWTNGPSHITQTTTTRNARPP